MCVQDQDTAHKAWLFGHKMLLMLHFMLQTGLQKLAPNKFAGPCIKQVVTGVVPYRTFTSTLYRDGLCFAGAVATVSALAVHMCS